MSPRHTRRPSRPPAQFWYEAYDAAYLGRPAVAVRVHCFPKAYFSASPARTPPTPAESGMLSCSIAPWLNLTHLASPWVSTSHFDALHSFHSINVPQWDFLHPIHPTWSSPPITFSITTLHEQLSSGWSHWWTTWTRKEHANQTQIKLRAPEQKHNSVAHQCTVPSASCTGGI